MSYCIAALCRVPAAEPGTKNARKLLLTGKYAEAADIYRPLAGKDPAAALGLARCLDEQGRADEAVRALTAVAGKHARLQAELARLAFQRGDVKEAKARADEAIKLDPKQVLACWIRAELDRTAGRLDEAERGYRRLVNYYNEHDVKDAETLHWIGLGAAQFARWKRLSDQFHFLINELYPDALKADPDYWPAHFEAGMLFLEKHNHADAAKEFKAALEVNPQAAVAHAAVALTAVEKHDAEQAERSLRRALEINPRLLVGWLVKADLAWANFEVEETLRILREKALPLNPVHEETLGRMAACYLLLDGPKPAAAGGGKSRFERLVEEVTQRNPHAGTFFLALAEMLESRNKQAEAETYFRRAIQVMPRQIGPHAGLGMLYMRTGDETAARKLLREAFEADPFNVRVKNTLEVLDVLAGMETITTEHFIIRHAKEDKLLGRYAAKYLEAIYPDLCRRFGYQPPGKSLVEVFNQTKGLDGHQWFSARMVGLPYIGTVAASTGRMVAMASPSEPQSPRRFNWARVLRHEMVHVVTLQQTKFNCPHWFTEGLAVWTEGCARPGRWNELLAERLAEGKLFDLQTINFGFARPESGDDWQMAYCQAELYVEYMLTLGGEESLRKMLAAYAENPLTAEAIRRVFNVSQAEFERGYVAYLKKLAAGFKTLKQPSRAGLAELTTAHRDRPGNVDAAAELAYAHLQRGAAKEALELAQEALKAWPKHQLGTYVVARLRLKDGQTLEAVEMLKACLDEKAPDPLALNLLAGLKLKAKQYDEAAALYALAERLDPSNSKWTAALARVYLMADKRPALAEALTRIARAEADDVASRKKLAELALARHDYGAAAEWARQALEIDVADAELHRMLAAALVGREEYPAAIEEFEVAIELKPDSPQPRFALADACVQAKQPAKARQVLEELLKRFPKYPGADVLLESLKERR